MERSSPLKTQAIWHSTDIGEDMTFAVIISGYHAVYAGIFGDSSRRGTERIHSELPGTIKDVLLTYFRKKT